MALDLTLPGSTPGLLRPFFSFYGGKWRAVARRYPPPEYGTIIEPFAGSAGYSVRYPDRDVVLVERDPYVAGTWRYLLTVSEREILGLPDIVDGQTVDDLDVCQEARWLIGWWVNKGTTHPCKRPSAWMRKGLCPHSWWGPEIRERISSQLAAIRHWTLIEGDYTDAPDIEATWFVDPPYILAGKHYRYGSKCIDYPSLATWCRRRQGQAIVCENTGADWLPFEYAFDSQATTTKHGGKKSREAIWTTSPDRGEE